MRHQQKRACRVQPCRPAVELSIALTAWQAILCALQVVRESLYDAFYKLTDSRSQITSYVFDEVR